MERRSATTWSAVTHQLRPYQSVSYATVLDIGTTEDRDTSTVALPKKGQPIDMPLAPYRFTKEKCVIHDNLTVYNNYLAYEPEVLNYPYKRQFDFWAPCPTFASDFVPGTWMQVTFSLNTPQEELNECKVNPPADWVWEIDTKELMVIVREPILSIVDTNAPEFNTIRSLARVVGTWIGSKIPTVIKVRVQFRTQQATTADFTQFLTAVWTLSAYRLRFS